LATFCSLSCQFDVQTITQIGDKISESALSMA
jgi:hypothetical protein